MSYVTMIKRVAKYASIRKLLEKCFITLHDILVPLKKYDMMLLQSMPICVSLYRCCIYVLLSKYDVVGNSKFAYIPKFIVT